MLLRSLLTAFGMYSRIPVPYTGSDKDDMRFVLCFFPLVGAAEGAIMYAASRLLFYAGAGRLLFACVMTVLPVLITGGIHLDGFMDSLDGICSYADKKRRLEILSDPHTGAFAVIGALTYFTLSVGLWSEIRRDMIPLVCLGCVISRALSALGVVWFLPARSEGTAAWLASHAHKSSVTICAVLFMAAAAAAAAALKPIYIAVFAVCPLCFLYHYYICKKVFGGITGDLAGYFLQLCELAVLLAAVIEGGIL